MVLRVAIGVPFRYGRGYGLGRKRLYTANRRHRSVHMATAAQMEVAKTESKCRCAKVAIEVVFQKPEQSPLTLMAFWLKTKTSLRV